MPRVLPLSIGLLPFQARDLRGAKVGSPGLRCGGPDKGRSADSAGLLGPNKGLQAPQIASFPHDCSFSCHASHDVTTVGTRGLIRKLCDRRFGILQFTRGLIERAREEPPCRGPENFHI